MPGDAVPEGGAGQVFAVVFDLPAAGMSDKDLFHGGAAHAVSAERIGHEELRDRPVQRAVTFRNAVDERKARKTFLCVDQVRCAIVPAFKIGGQPLITEQAVRIKVRFVVLGKFIVVFFPADFPTADGRKRRREATWFASFFSLLKKMGTHSSPSGCSRMKFSMESSAS